MQLRGKLRHGIEVARKTRDYILDWPPNAKSICQGAMLHVRGCRFDAWRHQNVFARAKYITLLQIEINSFPCQGYPIHHPPRSHCAGNATASKLSARLRAMWQSRVVSRDKKTGAECLKAHGPCLRFPLAPCTSPPHI